MDNQTCRQFSFTDNRIKKLKAPEGCTAKQIEYSDIGGCVGLKLVHSTLTNRKKFFQRLYFSGKKITLSLGEFPSVSVDQAREQFHYNKQLAAKGLNPVLERRKIVERPTFRSFAEDIYLPYVQTRKKTASEDQQKLERDMYNSFGDMHLDDITRADIVKYLNKILERTSPATANRHRALLSYLFRIAGDNELVSRNVVSGIEKYKEPKSNGRKLSDVELKNLLSALDSHKNQKSALAVKLLLLLGTRKGETLRIKHKNINYAEKYLTLEAHTTKTGLERKVPLSAPAIEVLKALKAHKVVGNPYLFPGVKKGAHLTCVRKTFESCKKTAGITNFNLHFCRHHFCTTLGENNVDPAVIAQLMGHTSLAMQKVYNHAMPQLHHEATNMIADSYAVAL